ncbi:piggyBac transposable element-derived protein 4-like [Vespula maculifrons]|uniref:PiggyBac transposable element-derived protein 4-like n=1 Tax=Vespula maculifrons TaxID=7453 RepID=A0ABD2CFG0_VESMC
MISCLCATVRSCDPNSIKIPQNSVLRVISATTKAFDKVNRTDNILNINLLDKINNIDEDCSEDDQEISDINIETA